MHAANNFWVDRNVFVTGATGLLGSWLTARLLEMGANVVILIRDWVPESQLFRTSTSREPNVVRGDLVDLELVERVLNEYEVQSVFHAAAQTIVGTANRSPISTFESNIRGTWCLLEAARKSSLIEQVVVASSDKAYGEHDQLPYYENAPLQGKHPYDVSKSCADLISQSYFHTYGTPVCITRCGNLFGGGDLNWNRLVPGTIRSVLRGSLPIIRSDGSFVRDYFYVEDAAQAYIDLAQQMASSPEIVGHAFNFSNEMQLNVRDLTGKLLELMGRPDIEPQILNQATNEIPHQYLSAEKARTLLGWKPNYSLDEGLKRTIGWYRSFFAEQQS
jgi:CDP-glucose 4,6-dehydratase